MGFEDHNVSQLAKLDCYLKTVNSRATLMITPKGNWAKAKVIENGKKKIAKADIADLRGHISDAIGQRLNALHPEGFSLDVLTDHIKLQSNGQELSASGRGTVVELPPNALFLRTASYWQAKREGGSTWFDVGWNFFDENWKPKGTVCWNSTHPFPNQAAVFSGDPTNMKDLKGRACQMIDLYPDMLIAYGVRYAVWSVLSYNSIPFSNAEDVLATLQWGEEPQAGKLYEPSRAQAVFPVVGKALTKYVAYLDLKERKLVSMDVGMRGTVRSATQNSELLSKTMPSFVEHLDSLPSIADIFVHGKEGSIPALVNDKDREIEGPAFVYQRMNAENKFEQIDLEDILNAKGDVVAALAPKL